ncbi:MAG TPA: tRNA lysidine(34) synthetase TilS [Acidimicrobiia bacterium]|nr:tRNA lysidine(34) synthetase TilS [Acidimicrobiia bacterium]
MARTGGLTTAQETVLRAVDAAVPEGLVVVALSGGADSASLAWAVATLGTPARAVSVDHGLPGSAWLMTAASAIAARLGLQHDTIFVRTAGTSETVLRTARLAALESAVGVDETILTGHTADDQAETVLGNLIRGAGAAGLAGIPRRRGRFARPLLGVRREVARLAAAELGLPFVDDPENADLSIRRNRLRLQTLPHLGEYNPQVIEAIGRSARLVDADDAFLEALAAAVPVGSDEEAITVPAAVLTTLAEPVATRVVRAMLRAADGPYAGEAADVDAVMSVAATGVSASLSGDLLAVRERALVVIHPNRPVPPPESVPLETTGAARFGPWTIRADVAGVRVPVGERAVVRAPVAGDRISIGGGRHKTVADALQEAGVPARLRPRWPLVVDGDRIAWIVGVRIAPDDGEGRTLSATKEER